MIEINGKYNSAKIFTEKVDDFSKEQIKILCDQEFTQGLKIRIMPDVHAGAGCTIGTTMTIKDKIVPNLVGVDIGCGMAVYKLADTEIDFERLDNFIRANIPSATDIREKQHEFLEQVPLKDMAFKTFNRKRAVLGLGSLGGGNHFIEVDKDDEGALYLVIHSGSRYLGKQTAEYYQQKGYDILNKRSEKDLKELIETLKREGRSCEIQNQLEKAKTQVVSTIDKALAYVENDVFEEYLNDMKIVQRYAVFNRKAIAEDIIKALGLTAQESFSTIHNYIDTDKKILRKGAVSAEAGEKLLIPINMRDGSLICVGKGNPEWNFSAPHGAGRLFSRKEAFKRFNVEEFKAAMKGIFTTTANADTLDECPMAYKTMEDIAENILPTAEIIKVIRPIYNFKAAEIFGYSKKNK